MYVYVHVFVMCICVMYTYSYLPTSLPTDDTTSMTDMAYWSSVQVYICSTLHAYSTHGST